MPVVYPNLTPIQQFDPAISRAVAQNFRARLSEADVDPADREELEFAAANYESDADNMTQERARYLDCSPAWLEKQADMMEHECRAWAPLTIPHDAGMAQAKAWRAKAKALRKAGGVDPLEVTRKQRAARYAQIDALQLERGQAATAAACMADRNRNNILRATMTAEDFEAHQTRQAERSMEIAALDAQIAQATAPHKQHQLALI